MPTKRPDIGRHSRSNLRRASSHANRIDDLWEIDQENFRIAMLKLHSLVSVNDV
jgi:hypothetical protein